MFIVVIIILLIFFYHLMLDDDNTAMIAGIAGGVGGLLLIVLIVVLCICCKRRGKVTYLRNFRGLIYHKETFFYTIAIIDLKSETEMLEFFLLCTCFRDSLIVIPWNLH